ncbi:MAG: glycosyltransferase family 9 protein [Verrucomicrobiota bacterium]|jgi:heptosyltransferase-2
MSTPALFRLREKLPEAHIALLTPGKLRDLWLEHHAINETISFEPDESVFAVGRKLRMRKFDLALVLPNSPRSAIETWLARIPQRIGHARPWRNVFLTQTVAPRADAVKMRKRSTAEIKKLISHLRSPISDLPATAHQLHEYLHLVAALGANPEPIAPQLFVAPEEVEAVRNKFGLEKIAQPVFGLNPGAEYGPAKRWPAERFIAAAREIQNRTNCVWLVVGGKGDMELAGRINSELRTPAFAFGSGAAGHSSGRVEVERRRANSELRNLAGKTSLRELMALLKLCRVLLTNDSGPMHVAAALGTPVVAPFGSTSPELTGPGLPGDPRHRLLKSDAPCSPCFRRECPIDFRCMNGITSDQVVDAVLQAIRFDGAPVSDPAR